MEKNNHGTKEKREFFRMLPGVDTIMGQEAVLALCDSFGRDAVTAAVREELDALRQYIRIGEEEEIRLALERFPEILPVKIKEHFIPTFRRVRNATGIILHTNLGRAPIGREQIHNAISGVTGYSNLEYDLKTGKRGKRQAHYAEIISKVTGSEDAVAVNNNAAAVMLMLSALVKGKEVLVSRGELIEIGGHFRIPDVMEQSGAVLREVGTTNRTRISDYENAITEHTGAILKVHTSNYKIVGFTEEASVEELVRLGKKYQLPVLVDLGSGVLVNLERYGLRHEPTVQEILKKGADVVCFSGDKLLGGPQAGIAAGKKEYIRMMEHHPLMRTLRPDKWTVAILSAVFQEYLDEARAISQIPVLSMLARTVQELKEQAQKLAGLLREGKFPGEIMVEKSVSMMGGGSLPGEEIPGYAVTISPDGISCEMMTEYMRKMPVPVVAHIKNDKIWLEMRTIGSEEIEEMAAELLNYFMANVCGNRTHPGRC